MEEGNLKYITGPFGEKSRRNGVKMWVNPFFLTPGPAERRGRVLCTRYTAGFLFS